MHRLFYERPLVQMQGVAGVFGGLRVMGDHHDGLAVLAVERLQQAQDLLGRLPVQVAGGLVADQQGRVGDDGAGDGHALLLAAGQFVRAVLRAVAQADQLQCDFGIALALRAGQAGQQQRQLDVALRGQHRHQVVELEHVADVLAAPVRELAALHRVDALAVDGDLPARGDVEAADQVEQGGLARAGGAHERHEIAAGDVQVHAVQDFDLLRTTLVGLGEVVDADQC